MPAATGEGARDNQVRMRFLQVEHSQQKRHFWRASEFVFASALLRQILTFPAEKEAEKGLREGENIETELEKKD